MNFSELFIRRPVTTVLVMAGVLFFGITAYQRLPVSDLPTVDFPTITVGASLPGASPETMASAVATPLEKQFSTIAGIDNMTSSSTLGSTNITIQFTLDRNIDAAAQDVQAMIAKTLRNLPPGIIPPSYQKTNPADKSIIYYGFTSSLMPMSTLDQYAETFMAQRIPICRWARAFGSSCTRTAYFDEPNTFTCATPDTIEMRCAMNVSAYWSSVDIGINDDVKP